MQEEEVDIAQLQEELEHARAQLEAFESTVADREARAAHLEQQLAEAQQEIAALTERSAGLETAVRESAGRYRTLALERSPELPEELVAGETVDEVERSVERARETVAKVRGHLETEAQSSRVPVGAPARMAPDLSGLSAEQKISRGIERRRSA